jgi:hypothetical protein
MTSLAIRGLGRTPLVAQGIAVLVLLVLVIISYFILQPVSDAPRNWAGKDLWPMPSGSEMQKQAGELDNSEDDKPESDESPAASNPT